MSVLIIRRERTDEKGPDWTAGRRPHRQPREEERWRDREGLASRDASAEEMRSGRARTSDDPSSNDDVRCPSQDACPDAVAGIDVVGRGRRRVVATLASLV